MPETITQKINRFYSLISDYQEGAPNTRYKSWEWCHQAFLEKKENITKDNFEEIVDFLSLHLAFYLASWGMYRGSSYLLQRDYKAHKQAVREILSDDYKLLWDYKPAEDNIEEANELLFHQDEDPDKLGIYWKVKKSYKGYEINNDENDDVPSDTLTTKILMGTFGCIPAFDRFLKIGIGCYCINHDNKSTKVRDYKLTQAIEYNDSKATGNKKLKATDSFMALASLVLENPDVFKIDSNPLYPPMKCVDMYLWEVGYEMDIAKSLVKSDKSVSKNRKEKLYEQAKELGYCDDNLSFEEASRQIERLNLND